MIEVSDEAASVMGSSGFVMRTRVESWLADEQLDDDIPVASGSESNDMTLNVPESVMITVPREYNGTSYVPGNAVDHPLACWGQRLRVNLGVDISTGTEWIGRGWYYITDASVDTDTVTVTASGLLGLIQEAQFVSPVTATGTYESMIAQLVEPALTCDFTNAPANVSIPYAATWDANSSRLDALNELLDTWGASAYVDEDGVLQVAAVGDTATSSLTLTDGTNGTAMAWGTDVSRANAANIVVAQGTTSDGNQIQAVAQNYDSKHPVSFGGNFSPLPVPHFFYSPMITYVAQATTAAATILYRRNVQSARRIKTDAVPYLALQPRDGLTVTAENLEIVSAFGIADQVTMPLTPADGAMTLGVRLV